MAAAIAEFYVHNYCREIYPLLQVFRSKTNSRRFTPEKRGSNRPQGQTIGQETVRRRAGGVGGLSFASAARSSGRSCCGAVSSPRHARDRKVSAFVTRGQGGDLRSPEWSGEDTRPQRGTIVIGIISSHRVRDAHGHVHMGNVG